MSKTIEISRELAEQLEETLAADWDPVRCECLEQLRAMLAAPVVERQEPVAHRIEFNDGHKSGWHDGPPSSVDTDDVVDGVIAGVQLAYISPPAPVAATQHSMKSVMAAICSITGFPMLTSNECHALAQALNAGACFDKVKELNQ